MSKNIGLWIDHKKAVVVILGNHKEETKLILSGAKKRVRFRGGTHPKAKYGAQYFPGEDHQDRQFVEQLNKFYDAVISLIRNKDSLLIFGPGEAKSELGKRIVHEKAGTRIAGIETADKMTDRQIVAKVRSFFQA
jgi:hypothetical protein